MGAEHREDDVRGGVWRGVWRGFGGIGSLCGGPSGAVGMVSYGLRTGDRSMVSFGPGGAFCLEGRVGLECLVPVAGRYFDSGM